MAPAQYASHEPTRFPMVPAMPTQNSESSSPGTANPGAASAPPNSIVTSLGIGTHADSSTIRTKTAA